MNSIKILLVEDNEGDILLTKDAFEEGGSQANLEIVRDGQAAIAYLERQGEYATADRPDLILLDVNLPKKNGHEVLYHIKQNNELKDIPVIMLTTSSTKKDIDTAYSYYANCYIIKPVEIADFIQAINKIEEFWFKIVQLPSKD